MRKNPAIVETFRIACGLLVCLGLMYGVYAILSMFSLKVFLGGILGYVLAVGNFFFMAISLMNIADQAENAKGGIKMQGGFLFRMLAIGVLLAVGIKSGYFDAIASVVPLFMVRPVIALEQFFIKNKQTDKQAENQQSGCCDDEKHQADGDSAE